MNTNLLEGAPAAGFYRDIPAASYHRWDACSNSQLSMLAEKSPAHMLYRLANPIETDAMRLGTATHCAILEPEKFLKAYRMAKPCCAVLKTGKRKGFHCCAASTCCDGDSWYCGTHAPETAFAPLQALSPEEWVKCAAMREAVMAHPSARKLVEAATAVEESMVWIDPETGLTCKGRMDIPCDGIGLLGDLKTTKDASRKAFEKSIFNFGYHRQAAMYLEGASALGREYDAYAIIAVENEPPHGVAVYALEADAIGYGLEQLTRLKAQYQYCRTINEYPAYPPEVQNIGLPKWAYRQIEETV